MAVKSAAFPPLSPLESTTSCAADASPVFSEMLFGMWQSVLDKMSLEIVLTSYYLTCVLIKGKLGAEGTLDFFKTKI